MMVEESAVKLIGLKAPIDVQSGRDVVTAKGIAYDHFHTQTIQSQASHGWWWRWTFTTTLYWFAVILPSVGTCGSKPCQKNAPHTHALTHLSRMCQGWLIWPFSKCLWTSVWAQKTYIHLHIRGLCTAALLRYPLYVVVNGPFLLIDKKKYLFCLYIHITLMHKHRRHQMCSVDHNFRACWQQFISLCDRSHPCSTSKPSVKLTQNIFPCHLSGFFFIMNCSPQNKVSKMPSRYSESLNNWN